MCETSCLGGGPARDRLLNGIGLHVSVTRGEHGGKAGRFLFATPAFARLLEMPMVTGDFQRPFAIDFLFQSPQGLFHRFALFKLNFCQNYSLPLQKDRGALRTFMAGNPLRSGRDNIL